VGNELNPVFFLTILALAFAGFFVQRAAPVRKILAPWSLPILYACIFILCSAAFQHLTPVSAIAQLGLWTVAFWFSALLLPRELMQGRVVLTTLISSIVLYVVNKAHYLSHLQLGLATYTTTILFSIGEIFFFLLLVYFTADTLRALALYWNKPSREFPISGPVYEPFVSIHLPISNEPVDVVSKTICALTRLTYPHYEVIVIDNNTSDEQLWKPIAALCAEVGFRFMHIDSLPGYKAGALNLALKNTVAATELIVVVDADYELQPEFLQDTVPAFQDPHVAFLQTAQRNRNSQANPITRAFNPVYDFFYDITMLARSQRNSSIFAGCAGLIRRSALQEAGGWADWSITEDAELSLRLLASGGKGIYISRSYGSGLMPETFRDVQRQWSRYFFGGLEITYRHLWTTILARNQLSFMQRLDFIAGGLIVLGAAVMYISSVGIIVTALTYSILQRVQPALSGDMLYVWTAFSNWLMIYNIYQAFGVFLLFFVFRLLYHFRWADAVVFSFSFQSLVTTQAQAVLSLITGGRYAFVRTPKRTDGSASGNQGLVSFELVMCVAMGLSLFALLWAVPASPPVAGYLSLALWQMMIYGITAGWSLKSA
jgi:cellulose synthase/poly-beta-1,6-N-acetylglucosamine synthase-like glycosyltransferase